MDEDLEQHRRPAHGRGRRLAAAVAAAVLVVAGVLAALALTGGEQDEGTVAVTEEPTDVTEHTGDESAGGAGRVVTLDAPTSVPGRCLVPTARTLARMETALDGTVTEVSDGRVRLEVVQWYAGGAGADTVELRDAAELATLLGGVPEFEPGQRYLVSAADGTVTVCGFTAPWSPGRAALFEEAFPS